MHLELVLAAGIFCIELGAVAFGIRHGRVNRFALSLLAMFVVSVLGHFTLVTAMAIILASYPVTAGINRLLADRSAAQER